MNGLLFPTLKNYKKEYLKKDIFSGIIMCSKEEAANTNSNRTTAVNAITA